MAASYISVPRDLIRIYRVVRGLASKQLFRHADGGRTSQTALEVI